VTRAPRSAPHLHNGLKFGGAPRGPQPHRGPGGRPGPPPGWVSLTRPLILSYQPGCRAVSVTVTVSLFLCQSVSVSLCHCVTVSPCHRVTVSLCHCVSASLCHSVTVSLSLSQADEVADGSGLEQVHQVDPLLGGEKPVPLCLRFAAVSPSSFMPGLYLVVQIH